jgi:hypothetical protein
VAYIREELERRARSDASVQQTIDRALTADSKAIAELDLPASRPWPATPTAR